MEFTVNGHVWRLRFVKPSNRHLQRSDGSWTIGVSDGNLRMVFVANNLSEQMTRKVVVHELSHVHAMEYNYHMPADVEEVVCDFMSLYGESIIYLADDIMTGLLRRIA